MFCMCCVLRCCMCRCCCWRDFALQSRPSNVGAAPRSKVHCRRTEEQRLLQTRKSCFAYAAVLCACAGSRVRLQPLKRSRYNSQPGHRATTGAVVRRQNIIAASPDAVPQCTAPSTARGAASAAPAASSDCLRDVGKVRFSRGGIKSLLWCEHRCRALELNC